MLIDNINIASSIINFIFILIKLLEKDASDIVTCTRRSIGSRMIYELT